MYWTTAESIHNMLMESWKRSEEIALNYSCERSEIQTGANGSQESLKHVADSTSHEKRLSNGSEMSSAKTVFAMSM